MFGRTKRQSPEKAGKVGSRGPSLETQRTLTNAPTKEQIKRASRTRFIWTLIAAFCLLVTWVFLILVEVGNTKASNNTTNSFYFINLDMTNIFPESVPDSVIVNSIAQTLGLHDFYTVGLWGFCEGYNGEGVSRCSKPETMYWFNPVEIILDELLSGATITLPAEVTSILHILKLASQWMFALFLSGACLSFVMMFLQPLSIFSRWIALLVMIFTFLAALFTTVATVVATVMFIIMKKAFTSVSELNIGATLGTKMFAFMWVAAGMAIIAFLIQLCLCCCCASRRDIRLGKKRGSKKAWNTTATATPAASASPSPADEKPQKAVLDAESA